jgi:HEAT repeat protein
MEKYNILEKEWITALENSDQEHILTTIHEIRNSGSVKILPVLFSMVNKNTDQLVRNEILKLLSEIKSQEAVPLIAESLDKNDFGDYLPSFIAACWQSGLDFSKFLRVFAGLFIQADYKSALEAFTVIEESLSNASEAEIYDCIHFLKEAECMVTDEKLPLFRELRKVVESS